MGEIYINLSFCKAGDLFISEWKNANFRWLHSPYGTGDVTGDLLHQEFKNMRFESLAIAEDFMTDHGRERLEDYGAHWFTHLEDYIVNEWISQFDYFING